jgi:hypothetical protein
MRTISSAASRRFAHVLSGASSGLSNRTLNVMTRIASGMTSASSGNRPFMPYPQGDV